MMIVKIIVNNMSSLFHNRSPYQSRPSKRKTINKTRLYRSGHDLEANKLNDRSLAPFCVLQHTCLILTK